MKLPKSDGFVQKRKRVLLAGARQKIALESVDIDCDQWNNGSMDDISPQPSQISVSPETSEREAPPTSAPEPLTYEETPIIEPVPDASVHSSNPSTPPPPRQSSFLLWMLLFGAIFFLGVWLSSFIRQFLPSDLSFLGTPQKETNMTPTPLPTTRSDPFVGWRTYSVISGITRKAVDGVSFKLPPEVSELFCDGVGCGSQGAYLPGGTRFTVAARGVGQIFADYRGKVVTDFGGQPFATSETVVGGRGALSFVGDFTGSTVTGYTFTKMRGVMIAVTDRLALEVNHFAPVGVTSDFASDDALFSKILETFTFTNGK
ncbi:hypothetical protein HYV22_01925 [Candidatus Gottesmanbacteria bacterium]|nr:hypothetical protein [Candidatus Gottesmanbacteria bacterium]